MFSVLLLSGFTYWLFLKNLPLYVIKQCFPYFPSYDQQKANLLASFIGLWRVITFNITSWSLPNRIFAIIIGLCCFRSSQLLIKNHQDKKTKEFFLILVALILFMFFSLHELFRSAVVYRLRWANPFQMLFIFLVIEYATRNLSKIIRFSLYGIFIFIALTASVQRHNEIKPFKNDDHLLKFEKTNVYLQNPPRWINTVTSCATYLRKNLKNDETLFALPYDPIYYFATDKKSPTRQLIFFDHTHIPAPQEKQIISDLEKNHVAFIVLSSRSDSTEPGLGTFGKTYCPLLKQYIDENFVVIKTFGDWNATPGWAWNHAVKVLKRNK